MEFNEVLPFLEENHLAVITTVGKSGKAQSTVVNAGPVDGKMAFASRDHTVKVKNARRSGRCVVTCIRPHDKRYITVAGPATVHGWDGGDETEMLALLRSTYTSMGQPPDSSEEFDRRMREEQRAVVLVEPERVYGSLTRS